MANFTKVDMLDNVCILFKEVATPKEKSRITSSLLSIYGEDDGNDIIKGLEESNLVILKDSDVITLIVNTKGEVKLVINAVIVSGDTML